MDAYIKYKDNPAILKHIAENIKIRAMGYKDPYEMVKPTRHVIDQILDPSSDEDDIWGGKKKF